jgi:RNA polymerase sigma-70 factor (ECF subfamily)
MPAPVTQKKSEQKQALERELKEWMLLARGGDAAAYARFLERVGGMIRAYFLNTSGRSMAHQADDLVQEVLIAIHRKKHLYDEKMPVLPWIYAIARYRLIDTFRASGRRISMEDWPTDPEGRLEEIAGAEPTPEDTVVGTEEIQGDIEEALKGVSDKQREILILAKVQDVPLAEIARKYGMSVSAVKVTIHRVIKGIRARAEGGESSAEASEEE